MLQSRFSLSWLCIGDFNEVLHAEEQIGGVRRTERQLEGFRDAVSVCGFTDLGYIGLPYTWDNRQHGDRNVKVRLDRGLANDSFLNLFRQVKVWHVQNTLSDHCGLMVECLDHSSRKKRKKKFRYENMWQRDPSYMSLVQDAWQPGVAPASLNEVQTRLHDIQSSLQDWYRNIFGSMLAAAGTGRREGKVYCLWALGTRKPDHVENV
jgi:hypothetical protein